MVTSVQDIYGVLLCLTWGRAGRAGPGTSQMWRWLGWSLHESSSCRTENSAPGWSHLSESLDVGHSEKGAQPGARHIFPDEEIHKEANSWELAAAPPLSAGGLRSSFPKGVQVVHYTVHGSRDVLSQEHTTLWVWKWRVHRNLRYISIRQKPHASGLVHGYQVSSDLNQQRKKSRGGSLCSLHPSNLLHYSVLGGWQLRWQPHLNPPGQEKSWVFSWVSDRPALIPAPIVFLLSNFNPTNRPSHTNILLTVYLW